MSVEFVDANVLVYVYDSTSGTKHDMAETLVTRLWEEGSGATSLQVLQEFFARADLRSS